MMKMGRSGDCLPLVHVLLTTVILLPDVMLVVGLRCQGEKFYCTTTDTCETMNDCIDYMYKKFTSPVTVCKRKNPHHKSCDGGQTCYHSTKEKCDGIKQCRDGEDERNCCNWLDKSCDDGMTCYSHSEICDGKEKCADKSDEKSCCSWDKTSCDNGKTCYSESQSCNGYFDCDDSTDEIGCFSNNNDDDYKTDSSSILSNLSMGEIVGIIVGVIALSIVAAICRHMCRKGCDESSETTASNPYAYSSTPHSAVELQPHRGQTQQFASSHGYTGVGGQPALSASYSDGPGRGASPAHHAHAPPNDYDYSCPDRTYTSFPSAGNTAPALAPFHTQYGNYPRPHSPANHPLGPSDITQLTNYGAADGPGPTRGGLPESAPMLPPLPSAPREVSVPPSGVPLLPESRPVESAPAAPPPTYESLFPE